MDDTEQIRSSNFRYGNSARPGPTIKVEKYDWNFETKKLRWSYDDRWQ